MPRDQPPGRRPAAGNGPTRRRRADDTLPGVRFPIVEDLGSITADDDFLDAIAAGGADLRGIAGTGVDPNVAAGAAGVVAVPGAFSAGSPATGRSGGGRGPDPLAALLGAWRSELLAPPLPVLPTLAPRPMLAPADRSRRRSMRSLLSVGAAICALLMASTAVGAHSAQPGEPLWGLSQVLWSDHATSVEAKVTVEDAMDRAKQALAEGDPRRAQQVLNGLEVEVSKVSAADGRELLQNKLSKLKQEVVAGGTEGQRRSTTAASTAGTTGSSAGPVFPVRGGDAPVVAATSRTTAPANPSAPPTGSAGPATPAGRPVAPTTTAGPGGNALQPVPEVPIVPVGPSTSSPLLPPVGPAAPAAPATTGATVPTTAAPVDTNAVVTAPPTSDGPIDPAATPTDPSSGPPTDGVIPPSASAEPSTPALSTSSVAPSTSPTAPTTPGASSSSSTADPSSSTADPSSSTADPSSSTAGPSPSTTDPSTDVPTEASTTSQLPTTVETTPSTDSDGWTTGATGTTTTQTAAGNVTDEKISTTDGSSPATTSSESGDAAAAVADAGR